MAFMNDEDWWHPQASVAWGCAAVGVAGHKGIEQGGVPDPSGETRRLVSVPWYNTPKQTALGGATNCRGFGMPTRRVYREGRVRNRSLAPTSKGARQSFYHRRFRYLVS